MEKQWEPRYISERLNGHLFRRIAEVCSVASAATQQDNNNKQVEQHDQSPAVANIEQDPMFVMKKLVDDAAEKQALELAAFLYQKYVNSVQVKFNTSKFYLRINSFAKKFLVTCTAYDLT